MVLRPSGLAGILNLLVVRLSSPLPSGTERDPGKPLDRLKGALFSFEIAPVKGFVEATSGLGGSTPKPAPCCQTHP
jgi:hypothetical protein